MQNDRASASSDCPSEQKGPPTPDPLSDVLRAVRLTGGVFLDVRLTAPYSVVTTLMAEDCRSILQDPLQLIFFHVVLAGHMLLQIEGEPPLEVEGGEVVLLTHNDVHTLSSAPGLAPIDGQSLMRLSEGGGLTRIVHGGGGEETHLICGFLGSSEAINPVFALLPRALKLDLRQAASREWVESSVRFAVAELVEGRLASSGVMSHLSEVLFVEAVRHFLERREDHAGWLRGFQDPHIAQALALIHRDVRTEWLTADLARAVGMSRSTFVEHFTDLLGVPPMRYQRQWRMQLACQQLREGRLGISQIAYDVGYDSVEAFSRAFKRVMGTTPADWRKASKRPA
ncbi:AraC family transcriptional regulator [Afifella sp. H1R]|uniref:AraC family transcriptional regulator n=1 Tax=Afifella sp. H1R TaxID=2908841 RepID=UPI001F2B81A9|nr:AraC family transcriptional regulator [Afifella sp. H1R]MCF1504645.1 AraC family transcriptional regulator [Afifella sp. H1R]